MLRRSQRLQDIGLLAGPCLIRRFTNIPIWDNILAVQGLQQGSMFDIMEGDTVKPPPSLDATHFARFSPFVRNELRRLTCTARCSAPAALHQVFIELFGAGRTRRDQVRFLLFAAPIARKHRDRPRRLGDRIGDTDISVADLEEWLVWLERFDPLCARMIDLHYFAGLSTKETRRGVATCRPGRDPRTCVLRRPGSSPSCCELTAGPLFSATACRAGFVWPRKSAVIAPSDHSPVRSTVHLR